MPSAFLSDFGLAKSVRTGSRLTRTGQALGTPAYMSPEQARGEISALAAPTDVWSLGCVLYEMLAGRPAFDGETSAATVGLVLLREPARLRPLRPDLPRGAERVVAACLAKRPAERYRAADELRDDLDRVLRGEATRARPPRRAWKLLVLGSAGLAVAAWAGVALHGPPPAPKPDPVPVTEDPVETVRRRATEARLRSPDEAARFLRDAVAARPQDRALRLLYADCLREAGRWRRAETEYDRLIAEDPADADARYGRGLARWHAVDAHEQPGGNPVGDLRVAGERLAGHRGALARAVIARLEGRREDAMREIEQAGDSADALVVWALIVHHEAEGGPEDQRKAVELFTRAIAVGPPRTIMYSERAHARVLLGEDAEAIEDYDAALALLPGHTQVLLNRADARRRLGDRAAAEADLAEAFRRGEHRAHALALRALFKADDGDHRGAIADYGEALALRPGYVEALGNRATSRAALGDIRGAMADLEEALRLSPNDPTVLGNRGVTREKLDDWAGARDDFAAALRRRPDDPQLHAYRGDARQMLGDLEGALEDYEAALRRDPGEATALLGRGNLRRTRGDLAGAVADFRAATLARPTWPDARANLGLALRDRGEWAGAARELGEFLRLAPDDPKAPTVRALLEEVQQRAGG
ncbi:MAG: tetratricopeptide repeat protein [Planctomycetales bacterium]|nr:tetratricopeptide repeat protein [Planctomycetales bacterium]